MSQHQTGTDADGVPPSITELVQARLACTGDSRYDIARRSTQGGDEVSQKYIHRLSVGDVKGWPKYTATFSGLAAGLETTELAIVLGYAVQLGIPVRMPETASRLPIGIDQAPARQRDALVTMARAIADPVARDARREHDQVPVEVDGDGVHGPLEVADGGTHLAANGQS